MAWKKPPAGEILVQVGDQIDVDQSIVVVESDKATVEVPSTISGTVEAIEIKEGDTVKEGVVILKVKTAGSAAAPKAEAAAAPVALAAEKPAAKPAQHLLPVQAGAIEIAVPDLGVDKFCRG